MIAQRSWKQQNIWAGYLFFKLPFLHFIPSYLTTTGGSLFVDSFLEDPNWEVKIYTKLTIHCYTTTTKVPCTEYAYEKS